MMTQTQIVFLIGYSVIFIYAVAIFGLIWQTSKKKNKNKTKKHDPQSIVMKEYKSSKPEYDTQTIAFYISLCISLLALSVSIIGLIITI